ncbi:MAG: Uma2 family endonuclease [Bacteroidales bacterium]|nr:Uma2 family endonuclease [Bacteroidales bacterium]
MELTLDLNKRYTYADYYKWLDDKRRELIDGFIRLMSPTTRKHQEVSGNLCGELRHIIKKNRGKCEIYSAPFDVRLPQQESETSDDKIYTVVQPDICIVCDQSKLDDRGCIGAPDFIAEIQSSTTAKYDLTEKFNLYEKSGVREYWVIVPNEWVQVFLLQSDGKYDDGTSYEKGKIPVHVLDGLKIDLEDIFTL